MAWFHKIKHRWVLKQIHAHISNLNRDEKSAFIRELISGYEYITDIKDDKGVLLFVGDRVKFSCLEFRGWVGTFMKSNKTDNYYITYLEAATGTKKIVLYRDVHNVEFLTESQYTKEWSKLKNMYGN